MVRAFMVAAVSCVVLALSPPVFAQQSKYGTEEEAKAMLTKAIAAVKADKTKALDMFNKGEGGFADRDLYPFCFNKSDGTILAVSNQYSKQYLGKDVRSLTDAKGKVYGPELYAAAQKPDGQISEVHYMFPRPDNPTPVQKESYVTGVGDVGCGVGYYE
jgi:signal transduction histidine kinase